VTVRPGPEITGMTGAAALPRRNGELAFAAPWQGRVLGMALTVVDRFGLPWTEFQRRLIDEIGARADAPYWDCWLAALERLVVERGVVAAEELGSKAHAP
jgi:nitrile hydratase accessory protein